jgi:hypothetical protein
VNVEIHAIGLLQLGDRVHEPVSRHFNGSFDVAERSTSFKKKRRDVEAVLGVRK